MASKIPWVSQNNYESAISQSETTGKPILLYFHSKSCPGCVKLANNVLSDSSIEKAISDAVIPVWVEVESDGADSRISDLVGSHIFIMSPTLQLVSSTDDIYHKFLGAPLHTRLDLGYTRVHHDIEGDLETKGFLAQLQVGMAKWHLFKEEYSLASNKFERVIENYQPENVAHKEATYWLGVARNKGTYIEDNSPRNYESTPQLAREVKKFCEVLRNIPDSELMIDWKGEPINGWEHYTDCLREFVFGVYQKLIDFSIETRESLKRDNTSLTEVHQILKEWQISYRQLQGTIVGLTGKEMDQQHLGVNYTLGKQRTIRNNLVHCVMSEFWAHGSSVRQALTNIRNNISEKESTTKPIAQTVEEYGPPPANFGSIQNLIKISESKHAFLMDEFREIRDDELDKGYGWWEGSPVTIRFRLNRMGWHLQDHAAVIETICERIGRTRSETERLVSRLYSALGKAEGEMVGLKAEERNKLTEGITETLKDRRLSLEKIYC